MDFKIRIKHYVDGYERIVTLSEYDSWRRTEERMGRPVFEVIGIILSDVYISLKEE